MDDHHHDHKSDENYLDPWGIFSPTERESILNIEDEDHLHERMQEQRDAALEKLWATFQAAASSLAQLYKERPSCSCCERCLYRPNNHERWLPFQGAANKVTLLYKDGSDGIRAALELGYRAGYQKRNRDITNWIKRRRRTIRREDILLNLSGRSPPRRKSSEPTKTNSISLSPKPPTTTMSPAESDLLTLSENREIDVVNSWVSDSGGRNPFSDGRKRSNEFNHNNESPHKRGRFF